MNRIRNWQSRQCSIGESSGCSTSCGRAFSGFKSSPYRQDRLNVLYAPAKTYRVTITPVVISEEFHAARE